MRKYIYVRIYFDPTGQTGLTNVFSSDPKVLDWVLNFATEHIPGCDIRWEAFDIHGARCEFQLDLPDQKDRELMNSIVKLLVENGYEPYAHDQNYMHFRRGND